MHAKTNSEATSLAPSSPERLTPPAYYVQSPSHDGEKTPRSLNSTPAVASPAGSPRHSSAGGGHSRESSASRCSAPARRKAASCDGGSEGRAAAQRGGGGEGLTNWELDLGLMEDEEGDVARGDRLPFFCYFLAFLFGFIVVFSLFCLILWGVSLTQKPNIAMQSIKFKRFIVQAGTDTSGVATDMISLNSTLKFKYTNTATFFGVHVSSNPISLSYSELTIATGDVQEFYKKRKQEKNVRVVVAGDKIPMYGNAGSLTTPEGMTDLPVTLKLDVMVWSRAHVLGKLVKQRFYNKVECFLVFATTKLDVPISLKNCTYHRS